MVTRHLAPDAETGETFETAERAGDAVLADVLAHARQERSALAEDAQAVADERSVMTHVDRMVDYIATVTAGRTAAALDRLAAAGDLTAQQRRGWPPTTRSARWSGCCAPPNSPATTRTRCSPTAVTARGLDDAVSPAQVLHHRISHRLTGRLTPHVQAGMADLIPADLGPGEKASSAASGCTAAPRPPTPAATNSAPRPRCRPRAWAVDALGPVPDAGEVIARQDWEHRAGWAAAYRELAGHTDEHDPLGNAPGRGRVEHRMLFRAAHDALQLPTPARRRPA